MKRPPIIKSNKQHIRLWFEFYKLAWKNPTLRKNLQKVHDFYEPWGDPSGVEFREWWKQHAYLFQSSEVSEITKWNPAPNALQLVIPLNQSVSKTLAEVKRLILEKQRKRLEDLGIAVEGRKSLRTGFGIYEINAKELRGRPLYEALVIYEIWLTHGQPKIGSKYLGTVRDLLLRRPRAKWLPSFLAQEAQRNSRGNFSFSAEQIRQFRRALENAKKVCTAVSNGRFPN